MPEFSLEAVSENEEFHSERLVDITIDVGSSDSTYNLVKAILPELREIRKIVHNRSKDSIFYETIVYGKFTLLIKSGFSSGFKGTGICDFQKFLQLLDVPEIESERYLFDGEYKKATMTIVFSEL